MIARDRKFQNGWRLAARAIVAALMLLVGLCGCGGPRPSRASTTTTAPPAAPVMVAQAGQQPFLELRGGLPGMATAEVREVELSGNLEANGQVEFDDRRVATIVSRVAGRIEATRVSQWDEVRRGEPIAALYSPDFMTAEAEYLQAGDTARVSRVNGAGLAAGGGGSAAEMAQSMVDAARRKLELLGMSEADIAAIRVPSPTVWMRAPISGTVLDNKAVRGSAVNPGDVLYTLGTLEQVWIVANIYETDLARIHLGQTMRAVTTAYPDQGFDGVIARISPDISADTHTLQIRCAVRNPGGRLKPQMLARVTIATDPGRALIVPVEALVFDTNDYFVYVALGNSHFTRRRVEIAGWKEKGYARVVSGLGAGERVVTMESIQMNALWHRANGESS
jgi:Cu(I)/Ag(I) efflux system membrane fusion protein